MAQKEKNLPADVLKKTRRIEIRTSRLVNDLFGGRYHSTFKGRGMEFVDVREYMPGDDIRSIHWNITARLGHPYIKRFTEERELTILIAVDVSHSHGFGTKGKLKSELAAELVSVLSFAALKNNDKIGLLLFSDKIETYIPPRKSKSHTLRMVRDALAFEPTSKGTHIDGALQYLNRVQKKKAIVFLISDFLDTGYEKSLKITQRHHDTIAFVVEDPMEKEWPSSSKIVLDDAETGNRVMVSASQAFRREFQINNEKMRRERDLLFSKINLDRVLFKTNQDYVKPLYNFFEGRVQRFRR